MYKGTHSSVAALLIALIPLVGWLANAYGKQALGWLAVSFLLILFSGILGHSVMRLWRGILIDSRNVISLSRLQMVVWTVVVMSAYLAAALYNVYTGVDEPLGINVPEQIWVALGISTTSLVGAPMLLSPKATKLPSADAYEATKDELVRKGESPSEVTHIGQLMCNLSPRIAQWSDMFTGDETSNGAHIDLAKVQMFFFTLLIVISYCAALWQMFRNAQPDGITAFPQLDTSTVALLGISHSGYLLNKSVPRP